MDKVLAFLEKYVEWIAIAIGGLVFMFAVWAYWIAPDVTTTVNGQTVGPTNVDRVVLSGPGNSLDVAMRDPSGVVIPPPEDLMEEFRRTLAMADYEPGTLAVAGISTQPPLPLPDGALPAVDILVNEAPTPPAAQIVRLGSGRSYASVPAAPQAQQVSTTDLAEVRVDYSIPANLVAQAFRRVALPPAAQNTSVLRVRLMRQRLLPNGSWGEEQEVPLLANNPLPEMPSPGATPEEKLTYVQFVEENPQWVLQPPFYSVQAGDDPMNLEVVIEVGGDEGEGGDGEGEGDTQTNLTYQDADTQDDPTGGADAGIGDATRPGRPQTPGQGGRPGRQMGQDEQEATEIPPPPGAFNAAERSGAIAGWAWDTDAVPGESYRYRVVYSLKNPMFQSEGITSDEQLQNQLALESEIPTDWSPAITVEPLTYYFMTGSGSAEAEFTVFRWQNGAWQSQKFTVRPGDLVGLQDAQGIDFGTGQTLVDVRAVSSGVGREMYALLVDEQGRFSRRTIQDAEAEKLKELQEAASGEGGVAQR